MNELDLTILEAIKAIVSSTSDTVSYHIDKRTVCPNKLEQTLFKTESLEVTDISIKITKKL